MQSRPHSMSSWRGPGKAGHYQISPIMGRRPSLTNGCLVVHMQSYTRLDANLTRTKILMKALMVSAGHENSWVCWSFMIAVNFRSQNYRSACIAGHLPLEQVLNSCCKPRAFVVPFKDALALNSSFASHFFLQRVACSCMAFFPQVCLPAVLLWHVSRRFVSTLLSLSNTSNLVKMDGKGRYGYTLHKYIPSKTWSRLCGKGWYGPTLTKYTRKPE